MQFMVRFTFWYLITCAYYSLSSALIGKNVKSANEKEFPFVVALAKKNPSAGPKDNYKCTGTVISKKLVLTAAHCFEGDYDDPKKYEILAGSIDLERSTANEVTSYITFNKWSSINDKRTKFQFNDIAIAVLSKDINPKIKPAIFSKKSNKELYDTSATLAGWGETENKKRRTILQTGKVKIMTNDKCEEKLKDVTGRFIPVEARLFCSAADPYVLTTCGDSGSPILRKEKKIIGINRGVCPKPGEVSNQKTVNLHLGLEGDYREFVEDVLKNSDNYLHVQQK